VTKTLDTLAREINTEHTACESAANAVVTHALRAGGLLTEVKGRLSHGEWGPWLVKNFAGSSRPARVYMRLHAHRDEIEAKRQSSANLSIDSAWTMISLKSCEYACICHDVRWVNACISHDVRWVSHPARRCIRSP
jgi:Protein of unknown function (DUF3102)